MVRLAADYVSTILEGAVMATAPSGGEIRPV